MSDPAPGDPSGQFCREVERAFVARRGGASVVSPADWQLILEWERRGVPLPVVVEGIRRAFDRRAAASGRLGLRACARSVEAAFADYRRRRAGLPETAAASGPPAPPSPAEPPDAGTSGTPPTRAAGAARRPNRVPSPPAERPLPERPLPERPLPERSLPARLLELAAGLRAWRPDASAVEPERAAAAASLAAGRIADLAASRSPASGGARPARSPKSPGSQPENHPKSQPENDPENDLEAVEDELLRSLADALRPAASAAITAAAAEPLAAFRRRMPPSGYREALAAAVRRRLPRALALPALRLDDPA